MASLEFGTFQVLKRHMWLVATALHNRVLGVIYVEIIVFVRSDSDEAKYEYKYKSEKAKKKIHFFTVISKQPHELRLWPFILSRA